MMQLEQVTPFHNKEISLHFRAVSHLLTVTYLVSDRPLNSTEGRFLHFKSGTLGSFLT